MAQWFFSLFARHRSSHASHLCPLFPFSFLYFSFKSSSLLFCFCYFTSPLSLSHFLFTRHRSHTPNRRAVLSRIRSPVNLTKTADSEFEVRNRAVGIRLGPKRRYRKRHRVFGCVPFCLHRSVYLHHKRKDNSVACSAVINSLRIDQSSG